MKTLNKIIATAAIVGSTLFGYKANGQIAPTKIATETSIVDDRVNSGILMNRIEAGNDEWTFRYDYHPRLDFETKPSNVGMFSLNKIYDKNSLNIGAEAFQVGNLDGKDTWFVDAWGAKKHKDISAMLDFGLGFPSNGYVQTYAIASFDHPKTTAKTAYYTVAPNEIRYYGFAAYHDHNIYASAGNKINTGFALIGTYGLKDFGTLTFATHDRKTGDVWIKSQTALSNVNEKFFSVATLNLAGDILSMPMFQPVHLSPTSTKGDYSLKLEYKKNSNLRETEVMVATKKIPFVQVGVGVNTGYCDKKSVSDVAVELYKDFKVKNFTGSAEYRYNNRTHTSTGYVKLSYNIGGRR